MPRAAWTHLQTLMSQICHVVVSHLVSLFYTDFISWYETHSTLRAMAFFIFHLGTSQPRDQATSRCGEAICPNLLEKTRLSVSGNFGHSRRDICSVR